MLTTELPITLKDLLERQLLTVVFQPIYHLDNGKVLGYEALIRGPKNSKLHSPQSLFSEAEKQGLGVELELACRKKSIEVFATFGCNSLLFLNANPQIFVSHDGPNKLTRNWLREYNLSPKNVVLEISEIYPIPDSSLVNSTLAELRQSGIKIALDDVGSGYSGPRAWAELEPDFVKIDRFFISGVHRDKNKSKFLKAASTLASELGTTIICEGIEGANELQQIICAGIQYGQGFLLNKPAQILQLEPAIDVKPSDPVEPPPLGTGNVGILLKQCQTVDDKTTAGQLAEIFQNNPELLSMPVVIDGIAKGLIWRSNLLEKFSTPFSRALHEAKPATRHLAQGTVIVDVDTTLEKASEQITDNRDERLPWHFIISDKGRYLGVGSVRDLLTEITRRQTLFATYANPLSNLPGNVPINQKIDSFLSKKSNFHLALFDLHKFKPFNDVYGYDRGDIVITFLAELLKKYVKQPNFLGHISGNDFVALFVDGEWQGICEQVLTEFDSGIAQYYDQEHIVEGGIQAIDREGNNRFYPLISLAIGVINPDAHIKLSHHGVMELAKEATDKAKQFGHSFTYLLTQ